MVILSGVVGEGSDHPVWGRGRVILSEVAGEGSGHPVWGGVGSSCLGKRNGQGHSVVG